MLTFADQIWIEGKYFDRLSIAEQRTEKPEEGENSVRQLIDSRDKMLLYELTKTFVTSNFINVEQKSTGGLF